MRPILIGALFVCAAPAQLARVGDINFYGLRKVSAEQVLGAAQLAPGDSISRSRGELEDRIVDLAEVTAASVETVCCAGDRATLFIGILERGEPAVAFHLAPAGSTTVLPADVMERYREYQGALLRAELTGAAPDAAAVRRDERSFQTYAPGHAAKLREELRTNPEPEQRAAAATAMRYATNKQGAVNDLIFALQDPDREVRMAALRSLAALAAVAHEQPALGIRIPPASLVDLLQSVVLTDRTESVKALLALTDRQNAATLDLLRKEGLPALAEMARWKTSNYARLPFQLLGRVAGLPDAEVNRSWEKGDREPIVQQALDSAKQ